MFALNGVMFTVVGLMSGTSMDGIDAAVIKTDGVSAVEEVGHTSIAYSAYVHHLLKAAEALVRKHQGNLEKVRESDFEAALIDCFSATMNFSASKSKDQIKAIKKHFCISESEKITFDHVVKISTDLHADIVAKLLTQCNLKPDQVKVIGYHGQTLYHNPSKRITIQAGNGQQLASKTGIGVVNDFRTKDVLAGGQGAPFAPLYHQALAVRDKKIPLAVVNCGGISNVTIIKNKDPKSLIGFDPGPGNSLVDRFVKLRTAGKKTMDIDGKYGVFGKVDAHVLALLHKNAVQRDGVNYLTLPPPKSLDVGNLFLIPELNKLSLQDGSATLEAFTADVIVESLKYIPKPHPKYWILAGGGWYNPVIKAALISRLQETLGKEVDVKTADQAGWNTRALEAQLFGCLAVRHLKGLPTSYPQTTGVPKPIVGGKYFHP